MKTNRLQPLTVPSAAVPPATTTIVMNKRAKPEITPAEQLAAFEEQKAALEQQKAALEAQQAALEQAEKAAREQQKAAKAKKAIELRELATQYDSWAKEEATKPAAERTHSPEHFLQLAKESRTQAALLEKELGLEVAAEELPTDPIPNYAKTHLMQRVMLIALPIVSLAWFFWLRYIIIGHNAELAPNQTDQAVAPYGLDSIQKVAFAMFVRAMDLLMCYGILKVIAPYVPDYLIPTKLSPKDAIHEFYNDLTAWQRLLLSALFVSAVLLYLALSPSVRA